MWATIWPMLQPVAPPVAGGVHPAAAGGSAATSRSVLRRTLSKNRRYEAMFVIMCVVLRLCAANEVMRPHRGCEASLGPRVSQARWGGRSFPQREGAAVRGTAHSSRGYFILTPLSPPLHLRRLS